MRKLYHSYLSPYARRVLIVLAERDWSTKVTSINLHESSKASPLSILAFSYQCILTTRSTGSNLIVEYLLKTYPTTPAGSREPPLASTMTRPDHHWEDARILATLETMTDSIMNLRQMKMSGLEPKMLSISSDSAIGSIFASIG